jgi:transposase
MIYHVYITDVMGTSQTVEQQTTLAPEETAPETLGPEKLTDIDAVRDYLMGLVSQGQSAQAIEMLLDLLLRMRDSHTAVSVRLQNALRQLYGRKSERYVSQDQLELFLGQLVNCAKQADSGPKADKADNAQPDKPKKPRAPRAAAALPAHLERRTVRIEPEPAECVCQVCGAPKKPIGTHVSQRLDFEPASFFVRVEERPKLSCPKCRTGVVCAPAADTPIDRALPAAGLLAQVVTAKFKDKQPANRQAQIYEKRYHVRIPTSTLGDWIGAVGDLLQPVAGELKSRTLIGFMVQTDDTGVRVLDRDDPRGVKRGHLWPYVGDGANVFVEYTPTWSGDGPQAVLMNRTGYIQCDGYAGYQPLFEEGCPRVEVGCWMHGRRGFEYAYQAGDQRGAVILQLIQKLYAVERQADQDGVDHHERLKRRLEQSAPVYEEIFELLDQWAPQVPPKTPLGKAIGYARNRRVQLSRFLEDGRIALDNGRAERLIRTIAVGRKNWLFFGSDLGAQRAANIYSVILSCELLGIDPWACLRDVLPMLGSCSFPSSRLSELLPEEWLKRQNQNCK